MESFFKTLKVERVYQLRYEDRATARPDIVHWIEAYYIFKAHAFGDRLQLAGRFRAQLTSCLKLVYVESGQDQL